MNHNETFKLPVSLVATRFCERLTTNFSVERPHPINAASVETHRNFGRLTHDFSPLTKFSYTVTQLFCVSCRTQSGRLL